MKKITAIILSFLMLINLTACGSKSAKSDDPNVGMWIAVSTSMMGFTDDIKEVFDEEISIDLKDNGKFEMMLEGEKFKGKWTYDGSDLVLSHRDVEFSGTIENGILTLINMMDIGLDIVFEKAGGYSGQVDAKQAGDAGYYVLEKAIEDGVEISQEEIKAMGMSASILLNEDGSFVSEFGPHDIDSGTWKEGLLEFLNESGQVEGSIPYELEGDQLTIDWDGDFIAIYMRSNDSPADYMLNLQAESGVELTDFQQLWDGEWYGYWEAHSVTDKYSYHDEAWKDCYAKIQMNPDDTGLIYLWDTIEDIATVEISVSEEGGAGVMGAAMSESGYYWNGDPIGHADWIIDPSLYGYDNYMVIDGRYEDEAGEGFNYIAYLRPWGQLWDDIPEEERPPWYGWYTDNYSAGSMMETVAAYSGGRIHSELAGDWKIADTGGSSGESSGGDSVGDVSGERISTGVISALCPDGWKSYDVTDFFSDDEDAIDLAGLQFNKGAQTEDDKYLTSGIEISYFDKDSYFMEPTPENYMVDNPEDWGPMELSGRTWIGFKDLDRGDTFIWSQEGDYHLLVTLFIDSSDDKLSMEDAEVQAIISSIGIE